MDKSKGAVARAKIAFFFKETFRAHSKAEYREIFSRGLNEDNSGITGNYPFLYIRAFLTLFILFTVNVLVLRLTDNMLYLPSITFLGSITFTIPFIILLYELYPKRDIALFVLLAVLVGGGTTAGVLSQLAFSWIKVDNDWVGALVTGIVEEVCKAIPAVIAIVFCKQKNRYASYIIAASVGAGFSVIEDMGYIFFYSDKLVQFYGTGVGNIIVLFLERGLSSLCTHALWTGAIGWAFTAFKKPYRSFSLFVLLASVFAHFFWNAPIEGWPKIVDLCVCVAVVAGINIAIVHISRMTTLAAEVDLRHVNDIIICKAKLMNERTLYTNAASFTFAFTCGLLSVIVLLLCSLPIGIEYTNREFADKDEFIAYIQNGYELTADFSRQYDPNSENVEVRYIEGKLAYVVQSDIIDGVDGEYYYGYYLTSGKGELDSISAEVAVNGRYTRCYATEYNFGDETEWVFEVNVDELIDYRYNRDGSVTAIVDAEDFEGYTYLIALCATAVAIAGSCTVVLTGFRIKLRGRLKNER